MTISVSSPVTGSAQTGFTSPTYTVVSDTAPSVNSKQWAVTALGGTQTGVTAHSVSSPFTGTVFRPAKLAALPAANPVTGIVKNLPNNKYAILVRKGALPYSTAIPALVTMKLDISIPSGVDTYSPAEVRAACSFMIGLITQFSAGLGDTLVTGTLG